MSSSGIISPDLADDMLFGPLSDYLTERRAPLKDLLGLIDESRLVPSSKRLELKRKRRLCEYVGSVWEAYTKKQLQDFAGKTGGLFVPIAFSPCFTTDDYVVVFDSSRNLNIYRKGSDVTEIDDVYELRSNGSRSLVIFEATLAPDMEHRKEEKRKAMLQSYGSPPFYCTITMAKNGERVGSYRDSDSLARKIVIPRKETIHVAAVQLLYSDVYLNTSPVSSDQKSKSSSGSGTPVS